MRDAWWTERELERLRQEQQRPTQVELELPLYQPVQDPEVSPEPDAVPRGVVVIEF